MKSTPFQINGYRHDGVLLNLSGTRDADECVIEVVTAADSAINLVELFPNKTLLSMAACVDARLEREARKHNAAARAERNQWAYEFRVAERVLAG